MTHPLVDDTRWQPVHTATGRAPSDELVCDCGASTVRVLRHRESDELLMECTGCGGAVLQLGLWEEAPVPTTEQEATL